MTIKDIYDKFILEYKLECQKRGVKEITLNEPTVALWISEAQQDIQKFVPTSIVLQEIELGETEYQLNSDFGQVYKVEIGTFPLEEVSFDEIERKEGYALYYQDVWKIKFNIQSDETVKVWYYQDFGFYSASGSVSQNWGTYDEGFSGSLKIPPMFIPCISYYLLSKIFDDYLIRYEAKLKELNGKQTQVKRQYRFNGGIC